MITYLWSSDVGSQGTVTVIGYPQVAASLDPLYLSSSGPSLNFLTTLASQQSTRLHLAVQAPLSKAALPNEFSGRILAAAWYCVVLDEAELLDIQVLPSARRQGWGRFLLQGSLGALASEGVNTCHLEVRRSNTAALSLYHKQGFEKVGERANYYRFQETREDAILLARSPLL